MRVSFIPEILQAGAVKGLRPVKKKKKKKQQLRIKTHYNEHRQQREGEENLKWEVGPLTSATMEVKFDPLNLTKLFNGIQNNDGHNSDKKRFKKKEKRLLRAHNPHRP